MLQQLGLADSSCSFLLLIRFIDYFNDIVIGLCLVIAAKAVGNFSHYAALKKTAAEPALFVINESDVAVAKAPETLD